jgi:ATP-binding cassette, subfamily B, bacterial PglK
MKNISNLIELINSKNRNKFFVLLILTFVSLILEIFLLKFIFIIFNYFSNPEIGNESEFYTNINFFVSKFDLNYDFYIILILILFFIFLFKTSINLFINWKKANFIFKTKEYLSRKFLNGYLFMPRIFHMRTNTAELIKNVTTEVDSSMRSLLAISNIILESILTLGIMVYLIIIDYKIAITCVVLFAFFSSIINFLNSKQSINLGKERVKVVQNRLKNIIESLTGSKTYEITGLRNKAISIFDKNNERFADISIESFFRNAMPKPLFELFTILFITVSSVYLNIQSMDLKFILPTLAVFFTAAYRLIPSLSTILTNLQAYEYNVQAINNLSKDYYKFKKINFVDSPKNTFKKQITFKNVSFTYDEKPNLDRKFLLENLNLTILKGEKIGIMGGSGSGKSTFLDILMGLLPVNEGKILFDEKNIKDDLSGWQKNIGCVPQDVFILDESLKKNIAFGLEESAIKGDRINLALEQSGLFNFSKKLPKGVETMVGERGDRISGGQKQRIGIARALYLEPEILILDESTSALDEQTAKNIVRELYDNNKSKTIIFVSHNLSNLIYCDHIFKIENKTLKKVEITKN